MIQITFYGAVYAFCSIFIFIILKNHFRQKKIDQDLVYLALIYMILGTLIGSRIIYILFYNLNYFLENPINVFFIWNGGLSFHGGLLGLIIATYIFSKKYKIEFLEICDELIIVFFFFLALGKLANFYNNESYGVITNSKYCINIENVDGCRHPVQIYELIKNLGLVFILLYLKNKKLRKGLLTSVGIFLYVLGRFFIDFYREYNSFLLGFSSGQILNIITIIISGISIIYLLRK